MATVGEDFADYRLWLEDQGVDTSAIKVVPGEFTSSCFINTDLQDNQITAFYPGAMSQAHTLSLREANLREAGLVIISPNDPGAMAAYAAECQALGIPYLYDPSMQAPRMSADELRAGFAGARVLTGNDYEFAMMAQKTGRTEEELIGSAPLTVVTRGDKGSTIYSNENGGEKLEVPVAPISEFADPTGAGDAYISGIVFGLARGFPLEVAGRVAALTAAYTVEQRGCQEHYFTPQEFAGRYTDAFGSAPEVEALAGQVAR
jgi:adenosine kinase